MRAACKALGGFGKRITRRSCRRLGLAKMPGLQENKPEIGPLWLLELLLQNTTAPLSLVAQLGKSPAIPLAKSTLKLSRFNDPMRPPNLAKLTTRPDPTRPTLNLQNETIIICPDIRCRNITYSQKGNPTYLGFGMPKVLPRRFQFSLTRRIQMGGCHNYGPFLGTLNITCRIIIGIQTGTVILTTTQIVHLCDTYGLSWSVHAANAVLIAAIPAELVSTRK